MPILPLAFRLAAMARNVPRVKPLVDIYPADGRRFNSAIIPSRGYLTPSGNQYYGPLISVDGVGIGDATISLTYNFTIGPDGETQNAHRVQLADSGYKSLSDVPAGATVRVLLKMKSSAGAGTQSIKFGVFPSDMSTYSIGEAGWTSIDKTVTSATKRPLLIQNLSGSAVDLLWAQVQIYGAADTIPAFTDEVSSQYALVPGPGTIGVPNSMTIGANSISPFAGRIPLSKDGISPASFSAMTVLIALKETGVSGTYSSVLFTPTYGSADFYTLGFGTENITDGSLALRMPGVNYGAWNKIRGLGWTIMAGRFNATASEVFLEEIGMATGSGGSPIAVPYLNAGGSGLNDGYVLNGAVGPIRIFNSYLSDADLYAEIQAMRDRLSLGGETAQNSIRNVLLWDGDSLSAGNAATNGYAFVQRQVAAFNPFLIQRNFAQGGAILGTPSDGPSANSLFGRLPQMLRAIAQAQKNGRNVIVGTMIGTNDSGAPNRTNWRIYYTTLRNAGVKTVTMTLPSCNNLTAFDANKDVTNANIRADAAYYDALADVALIPEVGADGAANNTDNFLAGIHPLDPLQGPMASCLTTAITPLLV